MSDQTGGGAPPPPGQPPQAPQPQAPAPAPAQAPPPQNWQSTPQQPGPPPAAGGQPGGGQPAWVANLTDQKPVAGPAGFIYADVPNRSIAMLIDVIAMAVIYFVIGIITLAILGTSLGFGLTIQSTTSLLAQWLLGQVIWAAYFIYTWSKMRGTVGMKLLGIQIGHQTDGRNLTYQESVYRYALLFGPNIVLGLLAAFVPSLGILGFLGLFWLVYVLYTMAQSPTKQGVQDKYGTSMVVKSARSVG